MNGVGGRGELRVVEGGLAERPSHDEREKLYDIESEEAVISNILHAGELIDEVQEFLEPEHFYSEASRWMYEACCKLREENKPIDNVAVGAWLREQGRLQQVGGWPALTAILNAAPSLGSARVRAHGAIVRDRWVRRKANDLGSLVAARCLSDAVPVEMILSETMTDLQKLTETLSKSEKNAEIKEVIKRTIDTITKLSASGGKGLVQSGFTRVDTITMGLHAELAILGARPGQGKTSIACQIATNVAGITDDKGEHPYGAYIASLETHDETLLMRVICASGGVELPRLRSGALTPKDWQAITTECMRLAELPIWIDDSSGMTVQELWTKCRRASAQLQAKGKKLQLVVVDYIQLLRLEASRLRSAPSREQVVSEVARTLVAMANELGCCVLGLAQLNRECEGRKDKRPILSDLRESGEIEQTARTIMFLYREAYYDKEADPNDAELNIAKQNNGPTGVVKLAFDPKYARFTNRPEDEPTYTRSSGGGTNGSSNGSSNGHAPTQRPEETNGSPAVNGKSSAHVAASAESAPPPDPEKTRMQEMLDLVTPEMDVATLHTTVGDQLFMSREGVEFLILEAVSSGELSIEGEGDARKFWRTRK